MSLNRKEGPEGLWQEVAGGKLSRVRQRIKGFLLFPKILVCPALLNVLFLFRASGNTLTKIQNTATNHLYETKKQ